MSATGQEIEVKFLVPDLEEIRARLANQGAGLSQARVHETNLRFDTPDGTLGKDYKVLRLRQDTAARLTYKGPGEAQEGARLRQELEFMVSDFDMARAFLEALGFQVTMTYEKYRTTYQLGETLVTLDEMPYGQFVEIEGPDGKRIQAMAERLGLDWEQRVMDSYTGLFDRLRQGLGLTFRDLTFENFQGIEVTPEALGLQYALPRG